MLFLNAHHAIANMLSLVRVRTGAWPEAADLRDSYLRELAGSLGLSLTVGPEINVAFEENPLAKTAAQQALFAGEGQSLGSPMTDEDKAIVTANIRAAFILLRHVDPVLHDLAWLQVSDIVCARVEGSGGGTASNLLGVIWLSPHPRWTTIDYAECVLHEAVHLNVFLGDMTRRLYVDARRLREPAALVTSAVRQEKRPIDKALHSACVAVALAYYYDRLGENATSATFLPPLTKCVDELEVAQGGYLTPYGQRLVRDLRRFVSDPDFEMMAQELREPPADSIAPQDSEQPGIGTLGVLG